MVKIGKSKAIEANMVKTRKGKKIEKQNAELAAMGHGDISRVQNGGSNSGSGDPMETPKSGRLSHIGFGADSANGGNSVNSANIGRGASVSWSSNRKLPRSSEVVKDAVSWIKGCKVIKPETGSGGDSLFFAMAESLRITAM